MAPPLHFLPPPPSVLVRVTHAGRPALRPSAKADRAPRRFGGPSPLAPSLARVGAIRDSPGPTTYLCLRALLLLRFSSDSAVLLSFLLKIRSVRILDTIVCSAALLLAVLSGLGRLETHPASWLHLSFRSHRPYRFRHDNRDCACLMLDHLQPISDAENLPFYRW